MTLKQIPASINLLRGDQFTVEHLEPIIQNAVVNLNNLVGANINTLTTAQFVDLSDMSYANYCGKMHSDTTRREEVDNAIEKEVNKINRLMEKL